MIEIEHQQAPNSQVIRLTIDERLSDDLIRVLITRLKKRFNLIKDEPKRWEDEKELLLHKKTYRKQLRKKLGLTKEQASSFIWDKLKEGQVCLLGAFQEEEHKKRGRIALRFRFEPKQKTFKQVDRMPKDMVKDLYLQTLTKECSAWRGK